MTDDKSKENNTQDLLELFSTKSTKRFKALDAPEDDEKLTQRVPAQRQSTETITSGAETVFAKPSSSASETAFSNSPSGSSTSIKTQRSPTKTNLSPFASLVLREARRELGNDYNFQQNQESGGAILEKNIMEAVDRVLKQHNQQNLDDMERANIIIHLQKDLGGWGVLQPLIDDPNVTDIHVYDHQTVVLQRGKVSETTGLHWPNNQAYISFLDRLLLRLGKSLSTQQHTIDASFPNGVRVCAIHESVCGARGPLLSIRVPRVSEVTLETLVNLRVAPPLIVNYLAALTRSGRATIIVAGETGTGKTTLLKCLGTQFGPDESIVAVEDTPELNFQHPYYRSLVSRMPNAEGQGEVTLQEHIKATLRMTPTRVVLGEMRTPFAAEAFLESAQTGHVGMSTIHARNAKETLVRLESLLGRAQKSVSVEIIRQQIALAVDCVVWMLREKGLGKPRIAEVIEVGHYVEGAIQVRPMFTFIKGGQNPQWRLNSWTSSFDDVLTESGIFLGDSPQEFGFDK